MNSCKIDMYVLLCITKLNLEIQNECNLYLFQDPSFHMSIFWINGNHKSEANNILKELEDIVHSELEKSMKTFLIDSINCKSGNKYYQYYFK